MKSPAYDPEKDFEPIALLATFPGGGDGARFAAGSRTSPNSVQFSKTHKDGRLDHGTPTTLLLRWWPRR